MILCEEPYLNEPGWASSGGTPQSRACKYSEPIKYTLLKVTADSANVRRMVVKAAVSILFSLNLDALY
jgi:hypothetical protein